MDQILISPLIAAEHNAWNPTYSVFWVVSHACPQLTNFMAFLIFSADTGKTQQYVYYLILITFLCFQSLVYWLVHYSQERLRDASVPLWKELVELMVASFPNYHHHCWIVGLFFFICFIFKWGHFIENVKVFHLVLWLVESQNQIQTFHLRNTFFQNFKYIAQKKNNNPENVTSSFY